MDNLLPQNFNLENPGSMLNREVYTYCENFWVHGNIFIQLYTLQLMTIISGPYVTRHEKIGLVCTKYTPSHNSTYLTFSIRYMRYVNCMKFPIVCCTSNKSFTDKLCLTTKLWNFKVQKSGQILCAHKPYFLMPGHIYSL